MEYVQRDPGKKVAEGSSGEHDVPLLAAIRVDYYTDPLCCWSWALEPQLRKLRYCLADKLQWNNIMCGMLPDWKTYSDPMNSVSRPGQMGPVWKEAQHTSGMPFNDRIWVDDPPASSYPACLAVKTAELQGRLAGELYLRKAREAVMTRGINVAKKEALLHLADELAADTSCFNFSGFKRDFSRGAALECFKEDMKRTKAKSIFRYPTLVLVGADGKGVIMTGYRPYQSFLEAIRHLNPSIEPLPGVDLHAYKKYWNNITDREIDEITANPIREVG